MVLKVGNRTRRGAVKGNVVDPVESSGVGPADRPAELPAAQVRRAAAGDRDAARALIERYQDLVYGYLGRMLGARGQSAAVDDVAPGHVCPGAGRARAL